MIFWNELVKLSKRYKVSNDVEIVEKMLKMLDPYFKTCARNSMEKAKNVNVFIPYEDFYSNILFAGWKAIEDFKDITESTFKNVILRRIYIAERETWKQYKKSGNKRTDKDGKTYAATQWIDIEKLDSLPQKMGNYQEVEDISNRVILEEFTKKNRLKGQVIYLLYLGYSCKECCSILNISSSYDAKTRKKMQRIRSEFAEFFNESSK